MFRSPRRRLPIRTLLPLLLAAALLGGCPAPVVRPPPAPPPEEKPVPPPVEKPVVRPPLRVEFPEQVALLLPLSGRQEGAGVAVRDGFIAAWFQQEPERRPRIRVYDAASSADQVMLQAIADGAQFIVGPLLKEDVAAAAAIADARVPVLALNFLPDDNQAPEGFFQFALSPEDEAQQVARRVVADGRLRGVALVPGGEYGARVLSAFENELVQLGGALVGKGTYSTAESDHSHVIQQILRLSDSRERHARLSNVLKTRLHFEPRRRGDIQFIYVAADPVQGRLIRPQLRFHYAGSIPMYATSEIYAPDETANIDLDGVRFPHLPWILSGDPSVRGARAAVENAWPTRVASRGRLYAFGYDAWQLVPELLSRMNASQRTTNEMIDGVTGRLVIGRDGRIYRDLDWAEIVNGQLRPLMR